MYTLICSVALALTQGKETIIAEFDLYGKLIRETETEYVGDFSERAKKFPIVGSSNNYSAVIVPKSKCTKHKEEPEDKIMTDQQIKDRK